MREKTLTDRASRIPLLVVLLLVSLAPFSSSNLRSVEAAVTTSITPTTDTGNLGTTVAPPNNNVYGIGGGTTVGSNLFHSFGQFNVGPGDIAQFQTSNLSPTMAISNILGRVTGQQSPSQIFGTIDSATYYPSANLFLMNPNGFLFGPNATVNVGGIMTFTTADYMRLMGPDGSNPGVFHADIAQTSILTSAPVAAFGFIGLNPAAINFEGGQLTVASGAGLALVGGDITLIPDASGTPSGITAQGRSIQMTSVAGPGEVTADTGVPAAGMALGTITLGQGTILDTSGDSSFGNGSGGAVSIRGGQLVATGATIFTYPIDLGSGGPVTVDVTGSATFTDSLILTGPSSAGSGGAVSVTANDDLAFTNTFIATGQNGVGAGGNGGPVTLTTNAGSLSLTDSFIGTTASAPGNGGAVTISGKDVTFTRSGITTEVDNGSFGNFPDPVMSQVLPGAVTITAQNTIILSDSFAGDPAIPIISTRTFDTPLDAGSVTIASKTVDLSNGSINTSTSANSADLRRPGTSGGIEIHGNDVNLSHFNLTSNNSYGFASTGKGGNILLRGFDNQLANSIQLTDSQINVASVTSGGSGNIVFQTQGLTLSNTIVVADAFSAGPAGSITVHGAQTVTLRSNSVMDSSALTSLAFPAAPVGPAGTILIETQQLTMQGGSALKAADAPQSRGNAGSITVRGTDGPAQFILIEGARTGIFTDAQGTGAGGNIFMNANQVQLNNDGLITASTTGAGAGGSITIEAGSTFTINAGTVSSTAAQAQGGDINITAGQSVTLSNDSHITAKSEGLGDAGNIFINAGQNYTSTNSEVTTQATALGTNASGGNITVLATDRVQLTNNSHFNASVQGSSTTVGGNITIDPQYVILQNSQIRANATHGQGGAISFTITNGGLFLSDANSTVSASSQFGTNGTVTIQNPNAPAGGQIQPLGKTPLLATTLLNQHCAALAGGEFSSFTVAGRDSLPTEPGSWLASPLATLSGGTGLGMKAEGVKAEGERPNIPILSLRQIAPAGFLTQAFAVDSSASCQS